jgi:methionyl-tRNA synthetase
MLFADVCARFLRISGDEVFFLCGADEHGARTEYVAHGYGVTPKRLLDAKFDATLPLLNQLELSFDYFGRTQDPFHAQFVQDLLQDLIHREIVIPGTQKVAWCLSCQHHLPDRFLEGTCPYCGGRTYGNQCNNKKDCARLVEPEKVIDAQCAVCAGSVEWRQEPHLFLRMDLFKDKIFNHAQAPSKDIAEVLERIQRTLAENPNVCITRDTQWGIPVPGLPGKTVYSWVDSLLAKVSMLGKQSPKMEEDYWKNSHTQHHFFLGMDGTPFYGALFPALLLASNRGYSIENWKLSPNEVFIYEGGICSKSTGTGIWLEEALATLPADFWRFYIFFVHANVEMGAERDVDFRWERFCETVNQWLLEGLKSAAEAQEAQDGPDGEADAKHIQELMKTAKIGEAFHVLMKSMIEHPSREKTLRLAPLLSCFLPTSGRELSKGLNPFNRAPLYAPQVQMDYQDRVDSRRAKRDLGQEITDARADTLCVCPINLREQ